MTNAATVAAAMVPAGRIPTSMRCLAPAPNTKNRISTSQAGCAAYTTGKCWLIIKKMTGNVKYVLCVDRVLACTPSE